VIVGRAPGDIRSVDSDPLAAGSYTYNARVAGNENYLGATSDDEPLKVNKAKLAITTEIHGSAHSAVGGSVHVPLGTVVHDTASVTGEVPGFPAPGADAVSFTLNSNAVDKDGATSPDAIRTVDSAPLHAGGYTYQAHVTGDDNYEGATSDEEPLTVDKAQLAISTLIHDARHNVIDNGTALDSGTSVHDTAQVTGAVAGFDIGAVSFTLDGAGIASDDGNGE
jgi:hypothetical protein